MKVALVIERFEPLRGGRETSTAQTAAALARRGCEVTVFCQSGAPGRDGVEVRPLRSRDRTRAGRLASFAVNVRRAVREGRFDIVHATLPIPGARVFQPRGGLVEAQAAAGLRRRRGLKRLTAQLTGPLNRQRRRMLQLEQKVVRDAQTACLAVSEMVEREFLNYYARSDGVRVVYNAVEVPDVDESRRLRWRRELRRQIGAGPNSPVFLIVAKNYELKGVAEAICAFARWVRSSEGSHGARLVAVGRKKVARYRALAIRRGVHKQVRFVGPTDDVFAWYSAADVCLLPSWYDPCSRVVLEAVRWSLPAVTTVYNGAAEALAEGAGIVVSSPADEAALTAAIAELADPKQRARRREACADVADRLGMDRHVDELLEVYREVTGRA